MKKIIYNFFAKCYRVFNKLLAIFGLKIIKLKTFEQIQSLNGDKDNILANFGIKYYNGITEVSLKSPIHDFYLLQRYPDLMITTDPFKKEKFRELFKENAHYMEPWYDPVRILHIMELMENVNSLSHGDILELGTNDGASAKLIYQLMEGNYNLFCLDTFKGFDSKDTQIENKLFNKNIKTDFINQTRSVNQVKDFILNKSNKDNLHMIVGKFPDVYTEEHKNLKFRLVNIDFDLYEPTIKAFQIVWPQVVPGGAVLIHDYKCSLFPGVYKATNEFFGNIGVTPFVCADSQSSAIVFKNK
jgi:hypothetical protein